MNTEIDYENCKCDWCYTNKCKAYQEWEIQEYLKSYQLKDIVENMTEEETKEMEETLLKIDEQLQINKLWKEAAYNKALEIIAKREQRIRFG